MFERQACQHPAIWKGTELASRDDWEHRLTEEEIAEVRESQCASDWPKLGQRLKSIQHSLEHGSGAAIVKGVPAEEFDEETAKQRFLEMAGIVGTPISQSAQGEMMFSVRDAGYGDNDPRSRGPNTRKRLTFHTDRCDVIAFMCLRQARSGGENDIVSSMAVHNEILQRRPDLLEVLMQPFYYQRHNVDTGNALPYCRQPVFSFRDGHFAGSILRVLIERAYAMPDLPDMTSQQREALDFVEEVSSDPSIHWSFRQEPGDILFLNNWVTFHRRSEFVDHEEPELRRHILRIWLSVPNSRPLDPLFKDNYGAVEAGAIRGGMRAAQS